MGTRGERISPFFADSADFPVETRLAASLFAAETGQAPSLEALSAEETDFRISRDHRASDD